MGSYGSLQGLAFLLNEELTAVEVFSQRGTENNLKDELARLMENNPPASILEINQPSRLTEEGVRKQGNVLLEFLISNDFFIFTPFKLKNRFTGGLALGAKLLGESYSADDLELLSTLVNQGAISVENARLQKNNSPRSDSGKNLKSPAVSSIHFFLPTLPRFKVSTSQQFFIQQKRWAVISTISSSYPTTSSELLLLMCAARVYQPLSIWPCHAHLSEPVLPTSR